MACPANCKKNKFHHCAQSGTHCVSHCYCGCVACKKAKEAKKRAKKAEAVNK